MCGVSKFGPPIPDNCASADCLHLWKAWIESLWAYDPTMIPARGRDMVASSSGSIIYAMDDRVSVGNLNMRKALVRDERRWKSRAIR